MRGDINARPEVFILDGPPIVEAADDRTASTG
jgi:hypothetical protein